MSIVRICLYGIISAAFGCTPNVGGAREAADNIATAVRFDHPIALRDHGEGVDADGRPLPSLSLADAVGLALDHDPRLQSSLARVRAAEADAAQARLLPNPILSFSLKFPDGGGRPKIEGSLAEDLIAVLQIPRRASAADNRLRGASADALGTAFDIIAELQEHYTNIQALAAQAVVLDERRGLLERLAKIARARVSSGEATPVEVTTIEAQQLALTQQIAIRKADELDERLIFARLIGQPSGETNWQIPTWQPPSVPTATERQWVAASLAKRPEVQAGKWELAALGDETALTGFAAFDGAQVGAVTERDAVWMAGPSITVPIPLLDWGQAKRAKATANQIEASHKLVQIQRQVIEEVRRAYAAFVTAGQNVRMAETQVIPLQERRHQQAEAAYQAGETDVSTLVLAEQELQQARSELIDLQQKMTLSLYRLERAVGGQAVASGMEREPATEPVTTTPSATTNNFP